jgi:hypothetical protein
MRIIKLVNFRKGNGDVTVVGASNQFTCQFSRAVTIKKGSKVCLIHAEINNTTTLGVNTGVQHIGTGSVLGDNYSVETTKPKELCFINCPSLPVQSFEGQANGGKGRTQNIIGVARTNTDDSIISSGIYVDLHNKQDLTLTEMTVEILDTDGDLKVFGSGGPFRQIIVLGIKEPCERKKEEYY